MCAGYPSFSDGRAVEHGGVARVPESRAAIRPRLGRGPSTAVIASTGQGEHADTSELEPLGVINYLTKPYDTGQLLQTLSDALEGKPSGSPNEL